jgi:16S rRNA (guanine527-N7)-methyltransferase
MTPEAFAAAFDVSRETVRRLEAYAALLAHWSPRINLIAPATLADVWTRHIADSAQLLDLAPAEASTWIDLGAGAGLPGLIVAATAAEKRPGLQVRLVESDLRKAVFLNEAIRQTGISATVEAKRIEDLPAAPQDVV